MLNTAVLRCVLVHARTRTQLCACACDLPAHSPHTTLIILLPVQQIWPPIPHQLQKCSGLPAPQGTAASPFAIAKTARQHPARAAPHRSCKRV